MQKIALTFRNARHFLQDPNVYPNPEVFDPERFIAREGKPAQPDPYEFCFGFGRRICPGALAIRSKLPDHLIHILSVNRCSPHRRTNVYFHGIDPLGLQYREGRRERCGTGAQTRIHQWCPHVSALHLSSPLPASHTFFHSSRPKPFKAVLKPRSAKAEALIRMYGDTA